MAGISMDKYMGILTTAADITQRSPESIGESMKTVISRYTNVKAGKFTASLEDQQSSDYNEDEYESLNDVETVLDAIGIKIRKNAKEFRDFEDVLEEIASKWDSFDQTTQNAIGTAMFGEIAPKYVEIHRYILINILNISKSVKNLEWVNTEIT